MDLINLFIGDGLLGDVPYSKLIYMLLVTQMTIMSVTIYLHRYVAHYAIELHPSVQHVFRFWLWLTTGMITLQWASIHLKHHAKCETEDDPHSPVEKGLSRILFFGVWEYVKAARDPSIAMRHRPLKTPKDWIEKHLYQPYNWVGLTALLFINVALFGVLYGVLIWSVQALWIPFWAAGVINGLGHWFSPQMSYAKILYQNWKDGDPVPGGRVGEVFSNILNSCNIFPVGLWIGGEELHGNHHAYPSSPKFSRKWYEVDIGWGVIKVLRIFGLAELRHNFR